MLIVCDGSPENLEELRAAINELKSTSRIVLGELDGEAFTFDQEWPDGQVTPARWRIEVGQRFNTETGAVLSATDSPE